MAANQLATKQQTGVTEFLVNGEKIKLSPQIVRSFLVNGQGNVTDQEIVMFIALCKGQKLNPFLREAHLIKYGNNSPATMVVGKDVFMKRAETNEDFDGYKAGVIVMNDNGFDYREGSFVMEDETVVGGWAEVYRKSRKFPYREEVSFREYAGKTKTGELNSQWASKPATMIRKVALVHALREAFPTAFTNMYSEEEMNVDIPIQQAPIQQPTQAQATQQELAKESSNKDDVPFQL